MQQKQPLLVCIVGPTAIGKTSLSVEIAKEFTTEIISADSRQFFKEMKIGTAVPSEEELKAAPHHFIQNRSIFEPYSVGDFERDALNLIEALFKKHQLLVMVGGSGLYVDAVTKGLDYFPEVDSKIREDLISEFEKNGIESLQKELKICDPEYYSEVDIQNHHRLIRALEICRGTGKPFSSFRKKNSEKRNFKTLYIGLTADRKIVFDRINLRVEKMMKEGLLEEAEKLLPHKHLNALQTVGYKELFEYFEGNSTLENAVSEIQKNTRRFAKRQGTWFRKNEAIYWFDYKTDYKKIVSVIKRENTP